MTFLCSCLIEKKNCFNVEHSAVRIK